MSERGLLDLTEKVLGWPSREEIFGPNGGAKRVSCPTQLIARSEVLFGDRRRGLGRRVGILAPNPGIDVSDPPLALVCEFSKPVSDSVIIEA